MSKIKLSQAWVDQVTSETTGDIIASGRDIGQPPFEEEISAIIKKVASAEAVREMVRRKWFLPTANNDRLVERGKSLQRFLFSKKSNRPAFATTALFRRHAHQRDFMQEVITFAWLCRVADKATAEKKLRFDVAKLSQKMITHLVHLSKGSSGPRDAVGYLEKFGVRVVIESSLPGMRTDGASFVVPAIGPVIGLTLRYDRLDSFWFTLLHELAHIILHLRNGDDAVFVDSLEDGDRDESEVEAEANAFAKDAFVPRDAWLRSDAFRLGTENAILSLAEKFSIHPAVVAGRLCFERKKYQAYAHLLGSGRVRNILLDK